MSFSRSYGHLGGWAMWFVAALFYAYEFIHRVAPSVLTNQLRFALSANSHELALIGAMYFYAYAAFQLPAGILVDKYGAKRVLVIASFILTLGSFLFSTSTSVFMAQVGRFMIGTGSAFAFVGCLKIGAQWLAIGSFPLVVGLTNLCGTLGALSGGAPLTHLVNYLGWRSALMQISFAGLFITLLLWLFLEDKKESSPQTTTTASHTHQLFSGLILVIKNPQSWWIAIYGAMLVAPIASLPEMWGVEFLKMSYPITSAKAAAITHTIFIGTAVGGPLIGWLMTNHLENELRFMMIATFGALILLLFFLYANLSFAWLYGILFFYGAFTANMLLCFSLMTEIHPSWAQGAAIGFTNMIIMLSAGFAQHGIGWLLHHLRLNHEGTNLIQDYHLALSVLPFCLIIALGLTFVIQKLKNTPFSL